MEKEINCRNGIRSNNETNYNLVGGRAMATVPKEEEVVISGISGAFPNSSNIHEFKEHLFNKENMVLPNRRWNIKHPEIPTCSGSIPEIDQYDPGFFGVHRRQADSLDPMIAMLLEKSIEAIFDAGLHPSDLENTRTGVFIGVCFSENDKVWFFDNLGPDTYAMNGTERSMAAHRLSYFLKVKGPSYTTDTACSSSLYALEHAYRAIRLGEIDNAIVGGTNLCLHPFVSLQFSRLGVLSKDGCCKPFDEQGNGYARSEAIGCLLLQKAKTAKRVYAQVIHIKTNCDGYKEQGITFPSKDTQRQLLMDFYDECAVDRYSLSFLEAHGTGTFVGDPEECFAIDDVFTRKRSNPLLIGSVKSNIGHSEPASGVCSIIKAIIGMETGIIPPNIHFNKPRAEIKGIVEGRIKVVSEKMPFEDDKGLIGVNSFGFGGGNCHLLLKWNPKVKENGGAPKDSLPRLICVSGRSEEAVNSLLDSVTNNNYDAEYIKLLHDAFRKNVENHLFRGYSVVSHFGESTRSVTRLKHLVNNLPPLYFALGELNDWCNIGRDLMAFPTFSAFIQRVQTILINKKVAMLNVFLEKSADNNLNHFLGSVIVQIGLVDLFNLVGLKPTDNLGYSIGEIVSSYSDGSLSLEEAINYAFFLNKTLNKVTQLLENNNSYYQNNKEVNDDSTINGYIVNGNQISNGSDCHSGMTEVLRYLKTLNTKDLTTLKNSVFNSVLKEVESFRNGKENKKLNYFFNTLFTNRYQNINVSKTNSVVVKIGHCPLNEFDDGPTLSLYDKGTTNGINQYLQIIGSLYEFGYNPEISKLYPPVELPVSRGTQMISPYFKWRHRIRKLIPQYNIEVASQATHGSRKVKIQIDDHEWRYIKGHVIDGRNLFPATGYLYLVWETFSIMNNVPMSVMQVCFENCKFIRATTVPKKGYISLNTNIQQGSGQFEVAEGDSVVVTGRIYLLGERAASEDLQRYNFSSNSHISGLELKTKDVYKELRLRGYNYRGDFRAIEECDSSTTKAKIRWEDNWVTFMDNMLQLKILQSDTRLLYVPTSISKITIMAKTHLELVNKMLLKGQKAPVLTVFSDMSTGTIRCGGINIWGLIATSISKRKILGVPVLEKYKFVPNCAVLDAHISVRVNTQIILENTLQYKVKAVELIDDYTSKDTTPLTPIIKLALEDQPLIQPFLKIFSKTPLEDTDIEVEDKKLQSEKDCTLVIASNMLSRPDILAEASGALTDTGYIITRESLKYDASKDIDKGFTILTVHRTSNETLLLLQKQSEAKKSKYIKIQSNENFGWLTEVQNSIIKEKNGDVVLVSGNESKSGILGLINCLRREPQSKHVRCVFLMDEMEKFNPENELFSNQLNKNMAINIYKNGQWGTYRHLLLEDQNKVQSEHCFANVVVRSDLSSLRWIEGPLRHDMHEDSEKELINIYYSSINFRDVMTASGKITVDAVTRDRLAQECTQGFEFSGRDRQGKRVMGMVTYGALSTLILDDVYLKFYVPDEWSLEEAATVPVVYSTVIYSLIMRGQMVRGESILIHSGTGGIGLAAIRIALHYGCTVFTTVGTNEKREFLKKSFPELKDHHIGNSHDDTFESLVYRGTKGRGVDIVLNSLAEDKLVASVRCLARRGRFIEIGKYDMANNLHLSTLLFQKEASFQGVMLDQIFNEHPTMKLELKKLFLDAIKSNAIKPLNRTVFQYNELEQAFRYMATGKHKGKVLIQIRKPEKELIAPLTPTMFPGIARFFCDPKRVYIVTGGLGGFGLELADWLILRGARRLVLSSRKGITTGYQNYRLNIWKTYGTIIKISTAPITTREGNKQLIEEALELGRVDAIFNLAVVLADGMFENQTPENFVTSFGPKAYATEYLDELTRTLCPDLSEFVVFSSVSCGRGNAGQTNYGMSNSVMERICEKRKIDGYPALAIEWGAVGEVGLVAEMLEDETEIEISGTLQQRISNCLQVMDTLLRQKDEAIVSSIVVAEKRGLNAADNAVDAVISILGLNDSKSVSSHSTLAELGMDSMTAVEIKQVLERDFELFLTAKDIRTMTLAKLRDIQNEKLSDDNQDRNVAHFGIDMVFRLIGDKSQNLLPYVEMVSNVPSNSKAPTLLLFPGIEGIASIYEDLAKQLNALTIGMQMNLNGDEHTVVKMAESVMPTVEKFCPNDEFTIVAYSYGTLVAMEVVNILESRGYSGTIIIIDGSLVLMKGMLLTLDIGSETIFETALLCHLLSFYISFEQIGKYQESIFKCATWDERVNLGIEIVEKLITVDKNSHDADYQRLVANSIYKRIKALMTYTPSYNKLRSKVKLLKPTQVSVSGLPVDYGLSAYFEKPVEVQTFEGNHVTILDNKAVADVINSCLQSTPE